MSLSRIVPLAALLLVPATAGAAGYRIVKAGDTVPFGPYFVVRRDCSTPGKATLGILRSPTLGTLGVTEAMANPNFPDRSLAHVCNGRKVPATMVIDHARPGASGVDEFSFALTYDFTKPTRHTFSILVQ